MAQLRAEPRWRVRAQQVETLAITARGQKWSGSWELDGKDVRVDSAYGSTRAPVGRKEPARVAEAALGELVRSWAER